MPQPASQTPHPARRAALRLMLGVMDEQRMISDLTAQPWFHEYDAPDRARGTRLALEALRGMDRADRVLKPLLRKAPPLEVHNILRLGLIEMAALGEAPHGVVNDMVAAAGRGKRTQAYKGMVNAVLRRAQEAADGKWGKMPVPRLPKWLRGPLMDAYGNGPMMAMESAHLKGAPLDVTAKADASAVADALNGKLLPTGSIRLTAPGQVSTLPGYESGDWWVQDAAAALPVQILAPKPGEEIADLCAAPGGKTMQLASAGANVTAVDASEHRLGRVAENLGRTGLAAQIEVADVLSFSGGPFDAVLLDAPCSATGTIRRHPDLPHARDGHGISELIALQIKMIDRAVKLLKPGGRLLYCTCSLLPDEGEVQVEEALERHPILTADRTALDLAGIDPSWVTEEGGLRLRPDYWSADGGMDGFYIACLRHTG